MAPSADGVEPNGVQRQVASLSVTWAIMLKACQMAGCFDHDGCIVKGGYSGERKGKATAVSIYCSSAPGCRAPDYQQSISLKARQIRQKRRNFIQSDFIGEVNTAHHCLSCQSSTFSPREAAQRTSHARGCPFLKLEWNISPSIELHRVSLSGIIHTRFHLPSGSYFSHIAGEYEEYLLKTPCIFLDTL